MSLVNSDQYGQSFKFGFLDGPTISGVFVRSAEIRLEHELFVTGSNIDGHAVALATSKQSKRKIVGTFRGYVSLGFTPNSVGQTFSFDSRNYIVRNISHPINKGEFAEVTIEGESFANIPSTVSAGTADIDYYGQSGFLEDAGSIQTDLFGLQTCTARFRYSVGTSFIAGGSIFDAHPLFGWLHMEKQQIDIVPGFIIFTNSYAGIQAGLSESVPIYELSLGVSEDPIQTHPKFVTDIAGTPTSPLNGAVFVDYETGKRTTDESKGVFQEFLPVISGTRNLFAGISSYLSAHESTWRERKVTTSRPSDISSVGYIQSPAGPVPGIGGSRNWLYLSLQYEQRGLVYFTCKEWKASAPGGWNTTIYNP